MSPLILFVFVLTALGRGLSSLTLWKCSNVIQVFAVECLRSSKIVELRKRSSHF